MAEEPKTKKKRLVKNPDTFRERAVKASESVGKPSRFQRARRPLSKISAPVSKSAKKAAKWKPLAILLKGLRLVGKIIFPPYLRNSWRELRLVTWPTWQQSRALTFAVLIFAIVFGASIAAVDFGLDKLFKQVLLK